MTNGGDVPSIEKVANGQRLVILAIVVNLASVVVNLVSRASDGRGLGALAALAGLAALILAIVGLLQLGSGMGYPVAVRVVLVVLALIPLVNLIMLVVVNARATAALRAAGYTVGLFGASR